MRREKRELDVLFVACGILYVCLVQIWVLYYGAHFRKLNEQGNGWKRPELRHPDGSVNLEVLGEIGFCRYFDCLDGSGRLAIEERRLIEIYRRESKGSMGDCLGPVPEGDLREKERDDLRNADRGWLRFSEF